MLEPKKELDLNLFQNIVENVFPMSIEIAGNGLLFYKTSV